MYFYFTIKSSKNLNLNFTKEDTKPEKIICLKSYYMNLIIDYFR